jgi:hypothetical protein
VHGSVQVIEDLRSHCHGLPDGDDVVDSVRYQGDVRRRFTYAPLRLTDPGEDVNATT